jgi:hypothetical protein
MHVVDNLSQCEVCVVLQAPASLLEALEQHLASLEGKKGAAATATTPSSSAK